MATVTVLILNVAGGFRARPAYLAVKPGDDVKFSNYSGQLVSLTFPTGLFPKDSTNLGSGLKEGLTVQDVADGRYAYSGTVNGVPVDGESSPEIIVDR